MYKRQVFVQPHDAACKRSSKSGEQGACAVHPRYVNCLLYTSCGSYRIVETSAPEGYLAWDGALEFAIESDGQVVDLTGDCLLYTSVGRLPRDESIVLISGTYPLKGAKYRIEEHPSYPEVDPGHAGARHEAVSYTHLDVYKRQHPYRGAAQPVLGIYRTVCYTTPAWLRRTIREPYETAHCQTP